jgi:hypothetical protein
MGPSRGSTPRQTDRLTDRQSQYDLDLEKKDGVKSED